MLFAHDEDVFWIMSLRVLRCLLNRLLHFLDLLRDADQLAVHRDDLASAQRTLFEERADAPTAECNIVPSFGLRRCRELAFFELLPCSLIEPEEFLNGG